MSAETSGHEVTLDTRGSYSRARCTCPWSFQSPDFEAVRVAAGEHVESHRPPAPVQRPLPREPAVAADFEALWQRAHGKRWPNAPAPGRPPTVREAAIASVEVNHLSRYGHVDPVDVAQDVDAVLEHVARYYGGQSW